MPGNLRREPKALLFAKHEVGSGWLPKALLKSNRYSFINDQENFLC
jgi:hypothetical protein